LDTIGTLLVETLSTLAIVPGRIGSHLLVSSPEKTLKADSSGRYPRTRQRIEALDSPPTSIAHPCRYTHRRTVRRHREDSALDRGKKKEIATHGGPEETRISSGCPRPRTLNSMPRVSSPGEGSTNHVSVDYLSFPALPPFYECEQYSSGACKPATCKVSDKVKRESRFLV
jgi:hypothetical protein